MNMLFYPADHQPVNVSLRGQYLARNGLSRVRRAFLGADMVNGKRPLADPTVRQAAMLVRVSTTYVHAALKQELNRFEIEREFMPLVPPKSQPANGHPLPAMASAELTDEQIVAFVYRAGIDRTLNAAAEVERAMLS